MINIKKRLLIFLVLAFLVMVGLVWLVAAILGYMLVFNLAVKRISLISSSCLKLMVKRLFLLVYLLSLTVGVKVLAFDLYKIPSSSMENMLFPGDVIVINKLAYGPRLPRSPFEIPLVNLFFYMDRDVRKRMDENWWDYHRWSGTSEIKRADVFVFNSTWDKNFILVKRCVGLPGDTLLIRKAEIYINSLFFNAPETVKNNYSFLIRDRKLLKKNLDSLHVEGVVNYGYKRSGRSTAVFSKQQLDFLIKSNCIDSARIVEDFYDADQQLLRTKTSKWTRDDMGPIIIPKKGMKIKLNPENFALYESAINSCENSEISEQKGDYFMNGRKIDTYTFKLNYYFMMGDNRKGTMDSRVWGFVPETNIIGKVRCVLYSNRNEEFQWRRIFKML